MPNFSAAAFRLFCLAAVASLGALGCASPAPQFECADAGCQQVCSMLTEPCAESANCCPGFICLNNACEKPCLESGDSCTDSARCCSGLGCGNGVCACLPEAASCTPGGVPCCGGTSCDGTGHCRAACTLPVGACQPYGGACAADGDCCPAGTCSDGRCGDPSRLPACSLLGASCATASDCCGTEAFGSRPDCVTGADGGGFCRFAQVGQACDSTRHCAPGVPCVFPVVDAGVDAGMDAGVDAGPDDAGLDDGGADAGEDDGGIDAGEDDGGVDAGAADAGMAEPVGVCTRPSTTATCTLLSQTCNPGDSCNPNSATNQGYDPCFYRVVQNRLSGRSPVQVCEAGRCSLPAQGDPCSQACAQTPGDPRRTICTAGYDGDPLCMPACTTDTDCRGANTYDSNLQNPQPITNLCVRYGNASACQPALCFVDGSPNFGNPNVLYKPCVGHPNTVCLPRFVGSNTALLGFCMAARPGGAPTVGQTCDPRAGVEATAATCGADATCLGGRCAAICDASQLGGAGTPACPSDQTCVSPQGLDLVTSYQFGGCADPCNPFTDLANSGCVNYCGGSSARCNWIIGDPKVGEPRGVCGAAVKAPIPTGGECTRDPLDPCESGNFCLLSSNGVTRTCTRLCDPIAVAGAPDACPTGQSCTAFASFTRSGYCR